MPKTILDYRVQVQVSEKRRPSAWPGTATRSSPPSRCPRRSTPLREKAKALGLDNLRVERLDLTDPYDIAQAQSWDIDVLWNNAGRGEAGPVWEIPVDLVRQQLRGQRLPAAGADAGRRPEVGREQDEGQGGLHLLDGRAVHAGQLGHLRLDQARARSDRRGAAAGSWRPYGIKVQTINPGAYYTGYNETMADNPFRWLDDTKHFTKRADLRKGFDDFFATPEGKMDPQEMIDRMIEIVPADTGHVPQRGAEGDRGHAEEAPGSTPGAIRSNRLGLERGTSCATPLLPWPSSPRGHTPDTSRRLSNRTLEHNGIAKQGRGRGQLQSVE